MTLYLGFDTAKLYRPVLHVSEFQGQGRSIAHNVTRAQPLLLMARLCLEQAFVDALRTRDGVPTTEARDSYEWLSQNLDWTRKPGTPIPPAEIRSEIIFSFEWCCSLLDLDAKDIRQHGVKRLSGFAHNSTQMLPGLEGIRAHWRKTREEYEERMAQQAREKPQGLMEVSV